MNIGRALVVNSSSWSWHLGARLVRLAYIYSRDERKTSAWEGFLDTSHLQGDVLAVDLIFLDGYIPTVVCHKF